MAKEIPLSKGYICIVDDEDFTKANALKWYAQTGRKGKKNVYAARRDRTSRKLIKMHRWLLSVTDSSVQVDHINGNGLDNRRVNLRLCSNSENSRNSKKRNNTSTTYKGVCFCKRDELYVSYINVSGKRQYLGYSKTDPEMLARLYDEAATRLHGKFAKLNFPKDKK